MINFACKKVELQDIIRCSFELTKTEYRVLTTLLVDEQATIRAISKEANLERSTIQKAIKGLAAKHLVERRQLNQKKGGYHYTYRVQHKEDIRKRILAIVEGWTAHVKEEIHSW